MVEKYPEKLNLTKTREYKKWESGIKQEKRVMLEPYIPIERFFITLPRNFQHNTEADETDNTEADGLQAPNTEADGLQAPNTEADGLQPGNGVDILQIAVQDLPVSPEINDLDDRIEQIIQELQQDDDLREFLNAERNGDLVHLRYEDDDEGIGLNVDVELQAVIELFDFELEVEGADW